MLTQYYVSVIVLSGLWGEVGVQAKCGNLLVILPFV